MTFLFYVLQALDSFKAESEFELTLSAGDIVIVRKVIYFFTAVVFLIFFHVANTILCFLNAFL
jgi:succinate dehydrogenase/fumarate reductase cytochrome b subunit